MAKVFAPLRYAHEMSRPFPFLTPYPVELRQLSGPAVDLNFRRPAVDDPALAAGLEELKLLNCSGAEFEIRRSVADLRLPSGGYTVEVTADAAILTGQDEAGLYYAGQTLLQLAGFLSGVVPALFIRDYPRYPVRAVMLDLGRGVYRKPLIKRIIRRMAAVKYNCLHLHLYDDQLMGVRFNTLPLGSENPAALSMADLGEIIDYAALHHVSVCPEMESWGHVGSIIHHYPELYGAPGKYEGRSFGISGRILDLMERIYSEIVPLVQDRSLVHLGLDEAGWKTLPDLADPGAWSPERLVGELHSRLQSVARRNGKNVTTTIWADHGGRPVPREFRDDIVVEPWGYHELMEEKIVADVRRYTELGTPFIMGAGASSAHPCGTFGATRIWCRNALYSANCRGAVVCMWETNDFVRNYVSMFGGATPLWNPVAADWFAADPFRERLFNALWSRLRSYQTLFDDAAESAIIADRGPRVHRGFYLDGPRTGESVAPTVDEVFETPQF